MRSAALGEPQAPVLTAVPTFPRERHSSASGGDRKEGRDLQAAQIDFGRPYRDAPPPYLLRPLSRRGK